MKLLILHPNFPAQFFYLARSLGQTGKHQIVYLTKQPAQQIPGVQKVLYQAGNASPDIHPWVRSFEEAIVEGQAVFQAALALRNQGFTPDLILGHTGWGSTLYLKDVFPTVPLCGYFEWFYRAHGSDVGYWPEEKVSTETECRLKTWNAKFLLSLEACDGAWTPTYWQHSHFPPEYADKIKVLHEGIDSEYFVPDPEAKMQVPLASLDLSGVSELITYVGRGFEPMRGFPQFMKAIEIVMKRRPQCHVVIVGSDRTSYGPPPPGGKTYKQLMLEQLEFDQSRLHFVGGLPRGQYRQVLQASTVHVYLTRPFVLSWSMLEAMSAGCTLVASSTPPVTEVINHRVNGLLADFRSPQEIASCIEEALENQKLRKGLSIRARETILDRYRLERTIRHQLNYFQQFL